MAKGADAAKEMLSVGIDVGTTTTQVVFSQLTVRNTSRPGMVPRLEVDSRAVLYRGAPHFTPLSSPDEVDVDRLISLVQDEYAAAGVDPSQVETGAVIVTGETARTSNASAILAGISGLAGDFVVTVAGPNLEAQIAGRGSGAAQHSAEHFSTVANVDIGGGSANVAVFRSGAHVASAASMVGGRQVTLDPAAGTVRHLGPSGVALASYLGLDLAPGRRADLPTLRRLTDAMADVIIDLVLGIERPPGDRVALTPPLPAVPPLSAVFLSGGVGRAYYDHDPATDLRDVAAYGDVGPLLARSLHESPRLRELPVARPRETLQATVLGAASQTVTLSGSTVWAERDLLPLRNLPVIEPQLPDEVPSAAALTAAIEVAVRRWDVPDEDGVALSLRLPRRLDYAALTRLADGVVGYTGTAPGSHPVVLVTERDYAQVLGQTIKALAPDLPLVAIDQVGLGEGDYIDIGEPLLDGRVVPVSVKTLVFYR